MTETTHSEEKIIAFPVAKRPTFEAGKTYVTRSAGDSECIYEITVAKLTEKTLTTTEGRRFKIHQDPEGERISDGNYSMAPQWRAHRIRKLEEKDEVERAIKQELRAWERGEKPLDMANQSERTVLESALESLTHESVRKLRDQFEGEGVDFTSIPAIAWAHALAEFEAPELDAVWID